MRLQFTDVGDANYTPFADINGDAKIRSNDGFFALQRQFLELPKGVPSAPPLPQPAQIAAAVLADMENDEFDAFFDNSIEEIIDDLVAENMMRLR